MDSNSCYEHSRQQIFLSLSLARKEPHFFSLKLSCCKIQCCIQSFLSKGWIVPKDIFLCHSRSDILEYQCNRYPRAFDNRLAIQNLRVWNNQPFLTRCHFFASFHFNVLYSIGFLTAFLVKDFLQSYYNTVPLWVSTKHCFYLMIFIALSYILFFCLG